MAAADNTQTDVYDFYKEELQGELDWTKFREICDEFNQMVMDEIILKGGEFNMGSHLSSLSILRIERNYKNKQVDWKASNEYKQELLDEGKELYDPETGEGHKWLIYYTDKWYCRFYWKKSKCKVPNQSVYKFKPTGGKKGNKTKLKQVLKSDDLAYTRFAKAEDNS